MKLEPLTLDQCQIVRIWRNAEIQNYRTPFMLTEEMQADFYRRCCDRNSPHRYFAIWEKIKRETADTREGMAMADSLVFIGLGGITWIQWENSIGEISLILDPKKRGKGLGEKAVDLLLDHAFNSLNLQMVFGECYSCNPALAFWHKVAGKYEPQTGQAPEFHPNTAILDKRKYYNGKYWHGFYFSIDADDFRRVKDGEASNK